MGFTILMMRPLTGFNVVQLIDHQLLKAGVRIFSSPQIFSSKLLSSCACSSTSIIHLIFFSTGLANPLILIDLLQTNFGQCGHYDLTMSFDLFNKLIFDINSIILNIAREHNSIRDSKLQLLFNAE